MKASYDHRLTIKSEDGHLLEGFQWGKLSAKGGVFFCLHGLGSHAMWYENLAIVLRDSSCCLVAVSRRGSGGSEGVRMYAENLAVLLDDLDLWMKLFQNGNQVTVIGHCWGAMLAKKWQEVRTPTVKKFILIVPPYTTVYDKKWHPSLLNLLSRLVPKRMVKLPYGAEIFSEDTAVVDSIKRDDYFQSEVSINLLKIGHELKLSDGDFSQCKIITAENDRLVNDDWENLENVTIISAAGHGLILEQARVLCDEIVTQSKK